VRAARGAVLEIHLVHDFLKVRVEALQLRTRRERHGGFRERARARRAARRAEQFITGELHGHREIQRRILRVGRNADQQVRQRQFLVGEPGALGTEQDCGRAAHAHLEYAGGGFVQVERAEILVAWARGGRGDVPTIFDCGTDAADDPGSFQDIGGPGRAGTRIRVRKRLGTYQDEFGQGHVLHRTRDRPDISGV